MVSVPGVRLEHMSPAQRETGVSDETDSCSQLTGGPVSAGETWRTTDFIPHMALS